MNITASVSVLEDMKNFNRTIKGLGARIVLNTYHEDTEQRVIVYSAPSVENGFPFPLFAERMTPNGVRYTASPEIVESFKKMGYKLKDINRKGTATFTKGDSQVSVSGMSGHGVNGPAQGMMLSFKPKE